MTANLTALRLPRSLLLVLAPLLAILLVRIAARTPLALAYPRVSAMLVLWIVADSLMLPAMARAGADGMERKAVVAVLAGAAAAALLVMPAPLREGLLSMPAVAAALAAVVLGHVLWGLTRMRSAWREARAAAADSMLAALSQLMPPTLARVVIAEARLLHLALFRWGAAPEVPAGAAAFAYHRHLVPIASVVMVLQTIEIGTVHLLVGLWSPTAALILSILSAAALVYLIGLVKSFRLKPVLIEGDILRVRTGILIDRSIPLKNIAAIRTSFASEEVKSRACLEAGLLAWPNILVELNQPVADPGLLRRERTFTSVAFRLDDPNAFVRLMQERLEERK